ncbi:MAG: BatD family protein [Deltaproteobacteria bacterium]|nr:BatD family protein [Deltaproteobacteria bacterium]
MFNSLKFTFLCLFLFLSIEESYADCIINARVDKSSVIVGDEIQLTVVLKYKEGDYCKIQDNVEFEKFKILRKDLKSEKGDGQISDTYTFVLIPLELGEVFIKPVQIQTSIDAGFADDEGFLTTPEIKINVQGVIDSEKEAKLKDILPPEKVYERTYILLYILALAIAIAVFVYLLLRYMRKRHAVRQVSEESKISEVHINPYEEAILALKLVEEERLISKSMYKELYLRLTEILKRFIERFYGFNAVEMTTYELTIYLMDHPQPNLDLTELKDFLSVADLVKFAKFVPSAESAYRDFNIVRNIIDKAARRIASSTDAEINKT